MKRYKSKLKRVKRHIFSEHLNKIYLIIFFIVHKNNGWTMNIFICASTLRALQCLVLIYNSVIGLKFNTNKNDHITDHVITDYIIHLGDLARILAKIGYQKNKTVTEYWSNCWKRYSLPILQSDSTFRAKTLSVPIHFRREAFILET
jgi:hypothetical protein